MNNGRTREIDGLRGWAAVVVVLFHFIEEVFRHVNPILEHPLIGSLLDGRLPVMIFFILSGDALSSVYFRKYEASSVDRLLVKRYFRLTLPVFVSCVGVYLLMRLGFVYHREAAKIVGSEMWLAQFLDIDASVVRLIKYSFSDVYVGHSRGKSFNPMLWTMSVEMVGSMLVFLVCYSWQRLRKPVHILAVVSLGLTFLGSMYGLFLFGVILAYGRSQGVLDAFRSRKNMNLQTWLALMLLMVVNVALWALNAPASPFMVLSAGIVIVCYLNSSMGAFLSNKFSLYLGDVSFPLYLTHFSVLVSILSYGIVETYRDYGGVTLGNAYGWVLGSLVFAFLYAHIFRQVEKWMLKAVDRVVPVLLVRASD